MEWLYFLYYFDEFYEIHFPDTDTLFEDYYYRRTDSITAEFYILIHIHL